MPARRLIFMVVEDHEFQRSLVTHMLEALGAEKVHTAENGTSALKLLKQLGMDVDIVISDLDMPGMDGMEFIRHLGLARRPISLIIASSHEAELLASVEAMAVGYGIKVLGAITKPVTPQKLKELIGLHDTQRLHSGSAHEDHPAFDLDEILDGLESDQFEPFFQPKVEIANGRVNGAEALARWRHPRHGIVGPDSFLLPLEKAGRIEPLMRCIVRKAAAFCRELNAAGDESTMAVNVSLNSLRDSRCGDQIAQIVSNQNVLPRHMIVDITESAVTTGDPAVLENLARLRMKGFGLSVDDYGTGHASRAQLTRIVFTELKIEQPFVTSTAQQESARVTLAAGLEMARQLNIRAVAEGVESGENWELLRELECDMAQGYYIAKPMTGEAYLDWLKQRADG